MLDQENEELSPFVIPQEDVEVLNASEGFCMLRNYLARDTRCVFRLVVPNFSDVASLGCKNYS
jgi:hypothetical protein